MASPPEQPWSSHEKNYLLAEILKAANPPPDVFFSLIRNMNVQPRWEDIPLPPGRSLNSCRFAFDELRRSLSLPQQMAAPNTPTPLSAPISLKRPYQYEGPYSAGATGREIRPKPSLALPVYSHPSPTDPPPKRKRGRPTKAEAQAKAEAAAAANATEPGPAPAQSPTRPATQTPALIPSPAVPLPAAEPKVTSAARMPIAAMLTPAVGESKSASHSSSSSGKKRRAKSTKSEQENSPTARIGPSYDSPYARAVAGTEDSPARTAVLRHRLEDMSNHPRPAPSGSAAETTEEI